MKSLKKNTQKNIQLKPIETKKQPTFKDYWNEIIRALIAYK